ncbi:DUF2971 domain-containing protein [Pseudoxanthomonas winnipegensis]|uniref:DUF2971 domain-containing protein n=1 Tax=Pseudoxanthomonas winnipegensis TaxID=2480810 RepID=UPI003CCD04C9
MARIWGDGGGAAIIFDTAKVIPNDELPYRLGPVSYKSEEQLDRDILLLVDRLCEFLELARDHDRSAAWGIGIAYFHARLQNYALTVKHPGFREEKEWRLIYDPSYDHERVEMKRLGYIVTDKGYQPKLKVPLESILGSSSVDDVIDTILLGPAHGSELAEEAVRTMLRLKGHSALADKVRRSQTPYRPV